MADLKLQLSIVDTEKVQTMIELLHKYKDDLPTELMNSLDDLADCDACEFSMKKLQELGINPRTVKCTSNGDELSHVVSVNRILKRVLSCRNIGRPELDYFYSYPDIFKMTSESTIICEW